VYKRQFQDIQVEAERSSPQEVSLVFVARENFFIGPVDVEGAPRTPAPNQLLNASKLQLGELFTEDKLRQGVERMQRLLQYNGYYRASITPRHDWHDPIQQVDVHFLVNAGEQARVGQVQVQGDPGYSPQEVESIAKLHPGDHVTAARTARALSRLRKKYQKKAHLEAQVSLSDRIYHPESNTVDYVFKILRGPVVEVKLEGAKLRQGLLKKYIPIYEENAVDDDLLNEGRRNLRDYLQTKGYFDASVDFTQRNADDHRDVIFTINKGERHKLTDLVIEGNHYFDQETLRERMVLQPKSLLLAYGRFSQSMVSRDAQSVESLYQANGFQQVRVEPQVEDDYKGETGRMRVTFKITEGPQTRVSSLKIVGNHSISESEIRDQITTTEGQPFSDFNVATDRDLLTSYYYDHGFPDTRLEPLAQPEAGDRNRINLTYRITEGPRVFVDRVLLSGLHFTKPFVATRELEVHGGDALSQRDILETQRRLYDVGVFNKVDTAVQNPEGQAREKNLLINMEEAKRYTFTYGFGLEVDTGTGGSTKPQGRTGVSPRVSFDVTRINFRGRDHTIIFKSRLGRLEQLGLLSYEQPRWLNQENLTLTFSGFYDATSDVRTFTAQRLEGSVQAAQVLSKGSTRFFTRGTTLLYRFTYRRVRADLNTAFAKANFFNVPLLARPVRIGMPSFSMIRDLRDDPTDSHKGAYNTLDAGVSAGAFGSEASFSRLLLQNSTYHPFKRKRWVLARSTRFGIEEPFGAAHAIVPLPERFFAGGGNSQRGFSINQAGPRDPQTGFPLGGEGMFLNQIELRTPPLALPLVENNLSAVLFHDAGNVFASVGDIFSSLRRFSQRNRDECRKLTPEAKCDFNYLSHAVGIGFRYRTPIGPVRVDVGYNLNPTTFPVKSPQPPDIPHVEVSRRFNFFFSIGQTF